MKLSRTIGSTLFAAIVLSASNSYADDGGKAYEVTITNITKGEIFTPIMVASHRRGVKLFNLGDPASLELEELAESGNTAPLSNKLLSSGKALDVVTAEGVLPPGKSISLKVKANGYNNHVSVASMLVPSNDAFFAVNGVRAPRGKHGRTLYSPAYDAGSEYNDELCVSIPGPPFLCQGEGTNPASGEGYVYIHSGIQGIGDINPAEYDWRNPVAKITIRKIKY